MKAARRGSLTPQEVVDVINNTLQRNGYQFRPTVNINKCGFIPRFFLRRYIKFISANFILVRTPVSGTPNTKNINNGKSK